MFFLQSLEIIGNYAIVFVFKALERDAAFGSGCYHVIFEKSHKGKHFSFFFFNPEQLFALDFKQMTCSFIVAVFFSFIECLFLSATLSVFVC